MLFIRTSVFLIAFCACSINAIVSEQSHDVIRTCNVNEYFHVDIGQCMECTRCKEGEYTWIPCSDVTNTICGPQWSPNIDNDVQNDVTPSTRPCESCNHTDRHEDIIMIIVCVCIVTSTFFVITGVVMATKYALKHKRELYYREEKSTDVPMMVCEDV